MYRKFGEVSEAAQLFETELGNILFLVRGTEEALFTTQSPARVRKIMQGINKSSLGQLLNQLRPIVESDQDLEKLLVEALEMQPIGTLLLPQPQL